MQRTSPGPSRGVESLFKASIPEWAIDRLGASGDGKAVGSLTLALLNAEANRKAGKPDPMDTHFDLRERMLAAWNEVVAAPLSSEPDEGCAGLRLAVAGMPETTRAADALARLMPFRETTESGTRARIHLDRAVSYLEGVMAVEAALSRPTMSPSRHALHDAQSERAKLTERLLDEIWLDLASKASVLADRIDASVPLKRGPAPRTLSGARPAQAPGDAPAAKDPTLYRVPNLFDVWGAHLKDTLLDILNGGHQLRLVGASAEISGGRVRYGATLGQGSAQVTMEAAYASGNPVPETSLRIATPGEIRTVASSDVHQALYEMAGTPASVRMVAEILRTDPDAGRFAIGATGAYSVQVSPNRSEIDPERFGAILRRIEAIAEGEGVKVSVDVDGVAVRMSDLLANGYEWAGRAGEMTMTRKPPATNILAFG